MQRDLKLKRHIQKDRRMYTQDETGQNRSGRHETHMYHGYVCIYVRNVVVVILMVCKPQRRSAKASGTHELATTARGRISF